MINNKYCQLSSLTPVNRACNHISSPHTLPLSRTCFSNRIMEKKTTQNARLCFHKERWTNKIRCYCKTAYFLVVILPSAAATEAWLIIGKARAAFSTAWLCNNYKWRKRRNTSTTGEHCDPTRSSCILVSITHQQHSTPAPFTMAHSRHKLQGTVCRASSLCSRILWCTTDI